MGVSSCASSWTETDAVANEVLADLETTRLTICRASSVITEHSITPSLGEDTKAEGDDGESAASEESIVRVNARSWRETRPSTRTTTSNFSDVLKTTSSLDRDALLMAGEIAGDETETSVESIALARHVHEINGAPLARVTASRVF